MLVHGIKIVQKLSKMQALSGESLVQFEILVGILWALQNENRPKNQL